MRRGTSPTLKIRIVGVDLEELENIYITIRQGSTEVTKTGYQLEVKDGIIYATLTQEDTLKFRQICAWVQMRATTKDGQAVASNIRMLEMKDILKDGVIE